MYSNLFKHIWQLQCNLALVTTGDWLPLFIKHQSIFFCFERSSVTFLFLHYVILYFIESLEHLAKALLLLLRHMLHPFDILYLSNSEASIDLCKMFNFKTSFARDKDSLVFILLGKCFVHLVGVDLNVSLILSLDFTNKPSFCDSFDILFVFFIFLHLFSWVHFIPFSFCPLYEVI